MEPAAAGVLYAAENLIQGAAALVKGITHPTLPIKANFTRIGSVPLARSHHTISIVKGRAYIFGGEATSGTLADNTMHIVILPSSGVLEADYTSVKARSVNGLDDVPPSRKGHSASVIGDRIYIYGGEGAGLAENGRIWIFDTTSNTWTHLDSAPGTLYLTQRVGHGSDSSNLPSPRTTTFHEEAPQKPVDPAKVVPEPAQPNSWGTIFIVGGHDTQSGKLAQDALAFDVRSRTWTNIPSPQNSDGASISLVGDHLYRQGGKTSQPSLTGATESLDVAHVWTHAESGIVPLTAGWQWQPIHHSQADGDSHAMPSQRSNTGLVGVSTGQGRHYLLAVGGEADSDEILNDVWALQLPSERATAAATKDGIRAGIKRDTHEYQWAEVIYKYVDTKGEDIEGTLPEGHRGVGSRRDFAIAKGTEVDGATAVLWGGVDARGETLGDGWMITVDR